MFLISFYVINRCELFTVFPFFRFLGQTQLLKLLIFNHRKNERRREQVADNETVLFANRYPIQKKFKASTVEWIF